MFETSLVPREALEVFRDLTFPAYRPLLALDSISGDVIGLGVRSDGQPIGFGLARFLSDVDAEILSLFVEKPHRGRGLGTRTLSELEIVLRSRGCLRSRAIYMAGRPSTAVIEHLLRESGWTRPRRRQVIFRFDRRLLTATWLRRARIRPPYAVVPWSDVEPEFLARLSNRQLLQPRIPDDLLPFERDDSNPLSISLGLLHQGELVGWLICHSIAPDTVRFTKLFVEQTHGGILSLGMGLLAEVIRRWVREIGPNSYVTCGARAENRAAIRLLRHLGPESIRESRVAFKNL